jgi:ribosomal-protein-alanine N-acetyltransferase
VTASRRGCLAVPIRVPVHVRGVRTRSISTPMSAERITLETPRLVLRPVVEDDVPELASLLADPEVFRFLCDGAPLPAPRVQEIVTASAASFREHGVGQLVVTQRGDRTAAGLAGFRRAEIGGLELLCALRPRHWGQGLAEEACRACLAFAFENGIEEVLAGADAPNAASLRLIARLGFEPLRDTPGAFGTIRWFVRRRTAGFAPSGARGTSR